MPSTLRDWVEDDLLLLGEIFGRRRIELNGAETKSSRLSGQCFVASSTRSPGPAI